MVRVFEMLAKFPVLPPQEPEQLTLNVPATDRVHALAKLKQLGAYDIEVVRELSENEVSQMKHLPSAEI